MTHTVLHRTDIQLHNCKSIIIYTFHRRSSLDITSLHFTSIHFNALMIISHSFPFRMRNVSDKSCRENQNTHFVFSISFIFENEIMWKNTVEWGRAQMAIWRMRIACWITEATNKHSQ
jgi:hypothetical protein